MKVLIVTNDFPPRVGGINYYVDQLARRFPEGGAVVLAPDWPGAAAFDRTFPHPVTRWPSRVLLPTPAAREEAVRLVREHDADVVLFGAGVPFALLGRGIMARTGVPYASFTHGVEIGTARFPGGRPLLRRIARDASFLTTVSRWTARILRRVVGPDSRIELLPPGVDAQAFGPDVSDAEVRARYGLGDDPVVCCVSRLVPRKGQDQVIRALPWLAREFPGVRFLVVGSGPDARRLRALARRLDVADRVIFTGEVPYEELPAHFRAGDVFAMPCRSRFLGLEVEGIGSVYFQAAAVGRPVVAGDSGGAPEAVVEGETGLVVDGRSVRQVAGAIAGLLREPERAGKMGARGAEWVHGELTWDAVAARLRELLTEVAG